MRINHFLLRLMEIMRKSLLILYGPRYKRRYLLLLILLIPLMIILVKTAQDTYGQEQNDDAVYDDLEDLEVQKETTKTSVEYNLNHEELELVEGETALLELEVTVPEDGFNVNSTSSDSSIVTVDENLHITALSKGNAGIDITVNAEGYNPLIKNVRVSVLEEKLVTMSNILAPDVDFSADITSGTSPLDVEFTDSSANAPTGWAWYFGDENITEPWTELSDGASWSARYDHSSVVLPDGSIVLMGGHDGSYQNDVWRSTDHGASWTQVNDDAAWSPRHGHSSVVLSDGSIVLMGGYDGARRNDVWRSTDQGETWVQQTDNAEWTIRDSHSTVALSDDSILLIGGFDGSRKNDVWQSTDQGQIWELLTDNANWSGRTGHSSEVLSDGSIVLIGGHDGTYRNDVWRSTDDG